jgi:hypothetical protein
MASDRSDHRDTPSDRDDEGFGDKLRRTWEGTKEAVADTFDDEDHAARSDSNVVPNPLAENPVLFVPDAERSDSTPEDDRPVSTPYEDRPVEDLRQLAAERDITGRSDMTKDELIAALREPAGDPDAAPRTRYENRTVDELRELAAERDITGRSDMTKDELIAALRADR